jgi:ligand-binding sensor domain-containing protein
MPMQLANYICFFKKEYQTKFFFRYVIAITISLVLNLFPLTSSSQEELIFKYITVADGLSQSHINCIMQDSKGFMWFGTQDGLNRYNAYDIKIFGQENELTNNIKGKHIIDIIEDKDKIIWFGTWTG